MRWVELVTLLAILQVFGFGVLVGRMRRRYGLLSPKMSGNEIVERCIRIQQNTFELLIMLIPSMWIAARYVDPRFIAGIGTIYLIGRFIYLKGYSEAASKRHLGFGVSISPLFFLIAISIWKIRGANQ